MNNSQHLATLHIFFFIASRIFHNFRSFSITFETLLKKQQLCVTFNNFLQFVINLQNILQLVTPFANFHNFVSLRPFKATV